MSERPPIRLGELLAVLETPDHDDGRKAFKWLNDRTVIVYYEEEIDEINIRSVSATRRPLAP
jgi:hypothetical protein